MLGKNSGQLSVFDVMIFERMIPAEHLLIKIGNLFDFSFVYELIKDKYSPLGRKSEDPVMMFKILLLEYLYELSDIKVVERIQTDVAFRWFLNLSMDDTVPDDTTISLFRCERMSKSEFEAAFNTIVSQCISMNLIESNRFQIDSTNIDANVNYPSKKKLARQAYDKVLRYVSRFDTALADDYRTRLETDLRIYHETHNEFTHQDYYSIVKKHLSTLYVTIKEEMILNKKLFDAYNICKEMVEGRLGNVISIVDTDARSAYKTRFKAKQGYKNSIIIDEDSEIILAYSVTAFNTTDAILLPKLVDKVKNNFKMTPKEVSADKGYASTENRAYLFDHDIISNINFYDIPVKPEAVYGYRDCTFRDNGKVLICPNGIETTRYTIDSSNITRTYYIDYEHCHQCPKREACIKKTKKSTSKKFVTRARFDAILKDMERVKTEAFSKAMNARYKIERRFATGVNNHSMRRTRYIGIDATSKHTALSNITINLIRALNLNTASREKCALNEIY